MHSIRLTLSLLATCSLFDNAVAEHFTYGEKIPAGVHNEQFHGEHCRISVYGPTGGSFVKGTYDQPSGELKISVDRLSHLTVAGRAEKVIVTFVDLNCSVDLTGLVIGTGGAEIHSVNRRSKVELGPCAGPVVVKSVELSTVTVPAGTRVIGRDRFFEKSKLYFEVPPELPRVSYLRTSAAAAR